MICLMNWQFHSQSPRYPCPAERENEDKGNVGSGDEIELASDTVKLCRRNNAQVGAIGAMKPEICTKC